MALLRSRLELNATGTDHLSAAAGVDLGTLSGWALSLWHQPNDRNFRNEPTNVGTPTYGVVFSQVDGSQRGVELDAGFDPGTYRLIVSDGVSPVGILRFAFAGGGLSHIVVR